MKKTLVAIATLSSLLVVPTVSAEVTAYGRVIYNIVATIPLMIYILDVMNLLNQP